MCNPKLYRLEQSGLELLAHECILSRVLDHPRLDLKNTRSHQKVPSSSVERWEGL